MRRLKALGIVFGIIGFLASGVMFIYENSFLGYPSVPDPGTSKTVPYVVKGTTRYVTQQEYAIATTSRFVFFPSWCVFMVLAVLYARRKKR